mmetsp:Transcript_35926/g.80855  ORF Transcript_35926/g.80855 Transcript_35926/m.80855 type:complete len:195 (+) Transcript_35926:530-1114(+)
MIKALDHGRDGMINYSEFSKFVKAFRDDDKADGVMEKEQRRLAQRQADASMAQMREEREKAKADKLARGRAPPPGLKPKKSHKKGGPSKEEKLAALSELWDKIGKYINEAANMEKKDGVAFLEAMFEKYDVDGDNELTFQELAEGLASAGIRTSKRTFKLLIKEIDEDESGKISLDEWIGTVKGHGLVETKRSK